jgi:ATP-dependent RNA helicase SUPV3L1/SUV3
VFDVLDLYLWFSYRFMDIFPDAALVRDIQKELDEIIQQGVFQITKLLQNSETAISSNQPDEDTFSISQRKGMAMRGK